MRRGRFLIAVTTVAASMLTAAGTALAADSQAIYSDAANGQVTQQYSQADLQAATKDATVQGYGGVEAQTMRPVVQAAAATKSYRCVGLDKNGNKIMVCTSGGNTAPSAACQERYVCTGVDSNGRPVYTKVSGSTASTSGTGTHGCVKGAQFTKSNVAPATGTLPFTGVQLGVFAAFGIALLAGGLLLRRAARD